MAEDILSQAELDTLLNSIEPLVAPTAENAQPAASSRQRVSLPDRQRPRDNITPHDFKRPRPIDNRTMRALELLHEGFRRNFAMAVSALLRSVVNVKLISADQSTYGEFVLGLEYPTCFNLLRAKPLECRMVLDINPSILYPIIDRLLGGGRDCGAVACRPLTEIELRLASRITGLLLQELRRAWQSVVELELSVERVESNPRLAQTVPDGEAVVLMRFEISINDSRGIMSLCIPCPAIQRLGGPLSLGDGAPGGTPSAKTVKQVSENLRHSTVELVVHLAESKITTGDMFNLRVGDIITTEKDVHSPMSVCLEGVPKFRGYPGAFKGHKAIEVDEALGPPPASNGQ